jgi:hypothetical protein
MHLLITIVGVVLTDKENYREWYRKIESTLIFNDLWNAICEAAVVNEEEVELVATEDESEAKLKRSRLSSYNRGFRTRIVPCRRNEVTSLSSSKSGDHLSHLQSLLPVQLKGAVEL